MTPRPPNPSFNRRTTSTVYGAVVQALAAGAAKPAEQKVANPLGERPQRATLGELFRSIPWDAK